MSIHDETWDKCLFCNQTKKDWHYQHSPNGCYTHNPREQLLKDDNSPSWDEYFMRHVYLAASKSKDPRTKIGAILVKNNHIVSSGFNGFPSKVKDLKERYKDRNIKYNFICHAEHNSILQCAKLGNSSDNSVLYTQGIPCQNCTIALIQGGVKQIICHSQWPNLTHSDAWVKSIEISKIMLTEAGIEIRWLDKKLGIAGFLDGKEIDV